MELGTWKLLEAGVGEYANTANTGCGLQRSIRLVGVWEEGENDEVAKNVENGHQ